MQWLISDSEPLALYAPVLRNELLQRGLVREILHLLPWYKKTRHMELILAGHLISVFRSGFERSYILTQMEKLDIPREVAERFLKILEEKGAGRFGEAQYFYNPVMHSARLGSSVVVQSHYMKNRIAVSETLAGCLRLIGEVMPRETCLQTLEKHLGKREYAEIACHSLAQMGLLLGCNSTRTPTDDYGPLRWNIEITRKEELLDATAWKERLTFVEDGFQKWFFQSRDFFPSPPIKLCGDYDVITRKGNGDYFWELSFKLQRFSNRLPINLKVSRPLSDGGWQEFRLRAPLLFNWSLTFDLRGNSESLVEEWAAFLEGGNFSRDVEVVILTERQLPARLIPFLERLNFKVYFSCRGRIINIPEKPDALRRAVEHACLPHLKREGCGAALSPYIDGEGDVYTCSLEGAAHLGNIRDGAPAIESQRQSLRRDYGGACDFGVAPNISGEGEMAGKLTQIQRAAVAGRGGLQAFYCP
jgi:hypothetical protein